MREDGLFMVSSENEYFNFTSLMLSICKAGISSISFFLGTRMSPGYHADASVIPYGRNPDGITVDRGWRGRKGDEKSLFFRNSDVARLFYMDGTDSINATCCSAELSVSRSGLTNNRISLFLVSLFLSNQEKK